MTMQVTGLNNFKVTNYQTVKQNPNLRYRGFKNDKISYGTRVGMTSTEKLA